MGYARPPLEHQFKPGQSGNPKGRPRKARTKDIVRVGSLHELVKLEAHREVQIKENGVTMTLPAIQASLRRLAVESMKGSRLAHKLFAETVAAAEAWEQDIRTRSYEYGRSIKQTAADMAALCERTGEVPPKTYPHPDDVILDLRTLTVKTVGPMNEEEEEAYAEAAEIRATVLEKINEIEGILDNNYQAIPDLAPILRKHLGTYNWLAEHFPPPEVRRKIYREPFEPLRAKPRPSIAEAKRMMAEEWEADEQRLARRRRKKEPVAAVPADEPTPEPQAEA